MRDHNRLLFSKLYQIINTNMLVLHYLVLSRFGILLTFFQQYSTLITDQEHSFIYFMINCGILL